MNFIFYCKLQQLNDKQTKVIIYSSFFMFSRLFSKCIKIIEFIARTKCQIYQIRLNAKRPVFRKKITKSFFIQRISISTGLKM